MLTEYYKNLITIGYSIILKTVLFIYLYMKSSLPRFQPFANIGLMALTALKPYW